MSRLVLLRVATLPLETLSSLGAEVSSSSVGELLDLERELASAAHFLETALYDAAGGAGDTAHDPAAAATRLAVVRLRRDVHNRRRLRPKDLERAKPALMPDVIDALDRYRAGRAHHAATLTEARGALAADIRRSRSSLVRIAGDALFEEGLRLVGRSLLGRVRALAGSDPARWTHDERHVASKVASYAARFCTKTSPNAVFSATALAGTVDEGVRIEGTPRIDAIDVLLNVAEARKVAECLAAEGSTLPVTFPRPNPTLREEEDGGLTYWKPANFRNPDDREVLSRVRDHPVLRALLAEAEPGTLPAPELLRIVADRAGVDVDTLVPFYGQAVERGILIAEVEIPYNSRRPLRDLAAAWRAAGCEAPWLADVENVESAVDRLAGLDSRGRIEAMDRIVEDLDRLPHLRPLRPDETFRLDAATALRIGLPERIVDEVRSSLATYVRMFAALYPTALSMGAYARRFLQLHPGDTDVPLLDLYHGFVEDDEYRRPSDFPEPSGVDARGDGLERAREAMHRLREALAARARSAAPGDEIAVEAADLDGWVGEGPEPSWACGVLFQIAAEGPDAIDQGRYRLVLSGLFNGIGLALARFAWLHGGGEAGEDNPIVRGLRRQWSALEREGAVLAELTYNHMARTANAGLRPSLFRHEIELPGDKASPGAQVLPLSDLFVRYDSARDRLGLFWKSPGVEVQPVIGSGVNPVGLVSFLVALGQQDLQYLGLFPGFHADGIRFWPRIVSGPLVLFRARWIFEAGEWPAAADLRAPFAEEDHFLETARWRRRHRLPRHVFVHSSEMPKPLYVDLDSPVFVDLLRRTTTVLEGKEAARLHVTEMLPGPEQLWIADERGRYASEFLVQMRNP